MNQMGEYDDIIRLPHHVSKKHPQMPLEKRAAQFQPFAALTGYYDAVEETGRQTERQIEPDQDMLAALDGKLAVLQEMIREQPAVTVKYFEPDEKKDGGAYLCVTGRLKKIDATVRRIILDVQDTTGSAQAQNQKQIQIGRILDIQPD